MRIGYFYRDFLGTSGMPREMNKLASVQAEQGNQVYVYCYGEDSKLTHGHLNITSFRRPKSFIGIAPELKKILENNKHEIDVLIIVGGHITSNYLVGRACMVGAIPYIVSPCQAYNPYRLTKHLVLAKKIWRIFFESRLLANAVAIRAYSQTDKAYIYAYYRHENIFILKEGAFVEDIPEEVTIDKFPLGRVNLLYLGRIDVEAKGVEELCEAISLVSREHSNVTLHIFGPIESGDEDKFIEVIHNLSPDKIKYHGVITGTEKFSVINSADLFVYPSRSEGIPRAPREALAMGVPVLVTSDTNMAEDVVEFGGGYAVDCNAQSIAQAIEKFLANPNRHLLREGALKLVKDRYSWDGIAREFSRLLQGILKR